MSIIDFNKKHRITKNYKKINDLRAKNSISDDTKNLLDFLQTLPSASNVRVYSGDEKEENLILKLDKP